MLEGSGIWPDNVLTLHLQNVAAVWLSGSPELIEARILAESGYAKANPAGRLLIERFVVRSQGYDRAMREAVRRLDLPLIEVTPDMTVDWLTSECLKRMQPLGPSPVAGETGIV